MKILKRANGEQVTLPAGMYRLLCSAPSGGDILEHIETGTWYETRDRIYGQELTWQER